MKTVGLEWQVIDTPIQLKEVSSIATPYANKLKLYAKDKSSVSALYYKNDAGTEIDLSGGLTGTGTANRLAYWTASTVLAANAALTQDHILVADANGLPTGNASAKLTSLTGDVMLTLKGSTNGIIKIDGAATGNPYIEWAQNGTAKANIQYLDSDDSLRLSNGGSVRVRFTTGGFVSIGDIAPKTELHVHSTQGVGTTRGLYNSNYTSDAVGPQVRLVKGRGTFGGATSVLNSADQIGSILFGGTNDTADAVGQGAQIAAITGSLWSGSNTEGILSFYTVPNGSTTLTERFRIGSAGQWGIGGATFGGSGDIFSSGGASAAPSWVTRATLNAALDHGTLAGLSDDDHTGYALLAGRSGGQTLKGDTASGGNLTLMSTNHATKGKIIVGTAAWDETNKVIGLGNTDPNAITTVPGYYVQGDSSVVLQMRAMGTSATPVVLYQAGRGTNASPAALQAADNFFAFNCYGQYDTTVGHFNLAAQLVANAVENFTSTAQGSRWIFSTSLRTTTTLSQRVMIPDDGGIAIQDGVSTPNTEAGWAKIFVDSADGDLKVKFGDGTVKTIVADT